MQTATLVEGHAALATHPSDTLASSCITQRAARSQIELRKIFEVPLAGDRWGINECQRQPSLRDRGTRDSTQGPARLALCCGESRTQPNRNCEKIYSPTGGGPVVNQRVPPAALSEDHRKYFKVPQAGDWWGIPEWRTQPWVRNRGTRDSTQGPASRPVHCEASRTQQGHNSENISESECQQQTLLRGSENIAKSECSQQPWLRRRGTRDSAQGPASRPVHLPNQPHAARSEHGKYFKVQVAAATLPEGQRKIFKVPQAGDWWGIPEWRTQPWVRNRGTRDSTQWPASLTVHCQASRTQHGHNSENISESECQKQPWLRSSENLQSPSRGSNPG